MNILNDINRWASENNVIITFIEKDYSSVCFITSEESSFLSGINGKVNIRSINENLKITPVSMNKSEINSAILKYLTSNRIEMLSNYSGIKSKILIRANFGVFSGVDGTVNAETLIKRMKAKKQFYPEMTNFKQSVRDYIILNMLSKFDASPCEQYSGSENPILFKVNKGKYSDMYGTITFSAMKRGSGWSFESLTDECKIKYFNKYSHERGYKILKLPDKLRKTNTVSLLSPQGNQWETIWSSFESGRNCPSDTYTQSYGERLVHSILKENDVDFKIEYRFINSKGTSQFMDFFVEYDNIKYCIEYNGIQHYEEVDYFDGNLSRVKFLDNLKKEYCKNNDITYIEIPYYNDTPEKVFKIISKYISLKNIPNSIQLNKISVKETIDSNIVVEYYKYNSYRKTLLDLDIGVREFNNSCKIHNFNKKEWVNNGKNTLN